MVTDPKIPAPPAASLVWALYVDCPKCGEENDLSAAKHDPEYHISRHIFSDDWDKLRGWEVECEHCGHEFTIEKVEY